jgi:hypothetical protein
MTHNILIKGLIAGVRNQKKKKKLFICWLKGSRCPRGGELVFSKN